MKDYLEEEFHKFLFPEPILIDKSVSKLRYNRYFEGIARKLENSIISPVDDELDEDEIMHTTGSLLTMYVALVMVVGLMNVCVRFR